MTVVEPPAQTSPRNQRRGGATSAAHRPDIDGLRGIAVLAVLVFHLNGTLMPGGFVGVDVFFVISGFVITQLIRNNVDDGSFSFLGFYTRRAWRLVPALIATAFIVAVVSFAIMPAYMVSPVETSVASALTAWSNIYFWLSTGYFDLGSDLQPLLHTWSLSLEWQFYFVYPAALVLLLRFVRRQIVGILIGIVAVGLVVSQVWVSADPSGAYYLLPSRIVEFGIGALTLWLSGRALPGAIGEALLMAGIGLIALSLVLINSATPFPGIAAMLPSAGTALAILGGRAPIAGLLVRNRPLVALGVGSYSLYLVHWPVIVFFGYLHRGTMAPLDWTIECALIALATASLFFLVEQPLRRPPAARRLVGPLAVSANYRLAAAGLVVVVIATSTSFFASSIPRPWQVPSIIAAYDVPAERWRRYDLVSCKRYDWNWCGTVKPGVESGVVVGDSHGIDGYNAVYAALDGKTSLILSSMGGCPPYSDIDKLVAAKLPAPLPRQKDCDDLNKTRYDPNHYAGISFVVIANLWGWFGPKELEDYLAFLDKINIKKIIIFGNYIITSKDVPELLDENLEMSDIVHKYTVSRFTYNDELAKIAHDHGALFIDKQQLLCPQGQCLLSVGANIPFTWDQHHLSFEFATELGHRARDEIRAYLGLAPPNSANLPAAG